MPYLCHKLYLNSTHISVNTHAVHTMYMYVCMYMCRCTVVHVQCHVHCTCTVYTILCSFIRKMYCNVQRVHDNHFRDSCSTTFHIQNACTPPTSVKQIFHKKYLPYFAKFLYGICTDMHCICTDRHVHVHCTCTCTCMYCTLYIITYDKLANFYSNDNV